jgi:hypothetical protein
MKLRTSKSDSDIKKIANSRLQPAIKKSKSADDIHHQLYARNTQMKKEQSSFYDSFSSDLSAHIFNNLLICKTTSNIDKQGSKSSSSSSSLPQDVGTQGNAHGADIKVDNFMNWSSKSSSSSLPQDIGTQGNAHGADIKVDNLMNWSSKSSSSSLPQDIGTQGNAHGADIKVDNLMNWSSKSSSLESDIFLPIPPNITTTKKL